MSVPFRERNPVTIGAISIAVIIALLVLAAFNASDLPLDRRRGHLPRRFAEAGGIKPNDEVRIAGVRVGKVDAVELDGDHVEVDFKVDTPSKFGTQTGAAIKVKTLLGAMFLSLEPAGSGQLEEDSTIPVSRTRSPYDVVQAFSGLADRAEKIDTEQLAQVDRHPRRRDQGHPGGVPEHAARPVPRSPPTVASRNEQINDLLKNLDTVSGVLADRDEDIVTLMNNSDILMRRWCARREAVHTLLVSTSRFSTEITAARQAVPRRPQAGAEQPRRRGQPARSRTRPTSTRACG